MEREAQILFCKWRLPGSRINTTCRRQWSLGRLGPCLNTGGNKFVSPDSINRWRTSTSKMTSRWYRWFRMASFRSTCWMRNHELNCKKDEIYFFRWILSKNFHKRLENRKRCLELNQFAQRLRRRLADLANNVSPSTLLLSTGFQHLSFRLIVPTSILLFVPWTTVFLMLKFSPSTNATLSLTRFGSSEATGFFTHTHRYMEVQKHAVLSVDKNIFDVSCGIWLEVHHSWITSQWKGAFASAVHVQVRDVQERSSE